MTACLHDRGARVTMLDCESVAWHIRSTSRVERVLALPTGRVNQTVWPEDLAGHAHRVTLLACHPGFVPPSDLDLDRAGLLPQASSPQAM